MRLIDVIMGDGDLNFLRCAAARLEHNKRALDGRERVCSGECTTMCAQRRLDSAVIAASVSSLTRASYTAQFTPWTSTDLPDLDIPLNKLFRRLSGNMPTFPTQLLYLPASMGGLGLPRLSTYVNTRKWCMAQRALLQTGNTGWARTGVGAWAARGRSLRPGVGSAAAYAATEIGDEDRQVGYPRSSPLGPPLISPTSTSR